MSRRRLTIVARPFDVSDAQFDGFVQRRARFIEGLLEDFDVSFVLLHDEAQGEPPELGSRWRRFPSSTVLFAKPDHGRLRRLQALLVDAFSLNRWERSLARSVSATNPDVVLTLGPWLTTQLRSVFREHRSVYLFEENLGRMPELASQSVQARTFRLLELRLLLRKCRPFVFVIADHEVSFAQRIFPRSEVEVLRYSVDLERRDHPDEENYVLAVGNFSEPRNAEGLIDLVRDLAHVRPADLRLRIVSGAGLTPELESWREREDWIDFEPASKDLALEYAGARLAVAPAQRLTGVKTTVLQAWHCGVPVVTSQVVSRSLAPAPASSCAVARQGTSLAPHVVRLWKASDERAELRACGHAASKLFHDASQELAKLRRALGSV